MANRSKHPYTAILGIGFFVLVPGLAIAAACAYYTLQDWGLLIKAYATFEHTAASTADLRTVFIAESRQNIYRINCFADGAGVLGGLLIASIAFVGMALVGARRQSAELSVPLGVRASVETTDASRPFNTRIE